jgi:hypothetical protein
VPIKRAEKVRREKQVSPNRAKGHPNPMKMSRTLFCLLALCVVSAAQQSIPGLAENAAPAENITVAQIVARLTENNNRRQRELQSYVSQREYHLLYTGFPGKHEADLVVEMKYQSPDSKQYTVISESGPHAIVNRVFKKLLETEQAAADQRSQAGTALTDQNYMFELLGEEDIDGRPAYVMHVEPKTENHLLYRGRVWIDAADFALCKIDAEPAKRPSVWISKVQVHHTYRKVGDFWLPAQNESDTEVRIGGHAKLSINYGEYKVVPESNSTANAQPEAPRQAARLSVPGQPQ